MQTGFFLEISEYIFLFLKMNFTDTRYLTACRKHENYGTSDKNFSYRFRTSTTRARRSDTARGISEEGLCVAVWIMEYVAGISVRPVDEIPPEEGDDTGTCVRPGVSADWTAAEV